MGPTATSSSAPPLMQQLLTRGLIQAPNVVAIEVQGLPELPPYPLPLFLSFPASTPLPISSALGGKGRGRQMKDLYFFLILVAFIYGEKSTQSTMHFIFFLFLRFFKGDCVRKMGLGTQVCYATSCQCVYVRSQDDDDENFCRICRCVEPQADLFSPWCGATESGSWASASGGNVCS